MLESFQKFQIPISKSQVKSNRSDPKGTASVVLAVLGDCFTNARRGCANSNVRSSTSRGLVLHFGIWVLILYLGFGAWDLQPRWDLEFAAPMLR
jgi:hypothetical protein